MKKRICFILMLALLLTGCQVSAPSAPSAPSAITIYYVEQEPLYKAAIEAYKTAHPNVIVTVDSFSSYDAMNRQMKTDTKQGSEPDVILYNSLKSDIDPLDAMRSGAFYPIDQAATYVSDDLLSDVFLECGKYCGSQYLLPLSWNIMQCYGTERLVEENQYDLSDLYTVLLTEAERLSEDETRCANTLQFLRADALNFMLENMGVELTNGITVTATYEAVQAAAEFTKGFYDNITKVSAITQKYSNDFLGVASHVSFFIENYSFMHNLRHYQSVFPEMIGEEMVFAPFYHRDGQGITAQIIHYGAVSATTDNPRESQAFLEFLFRYPADMRFEKYGAGVYYAPVSKTEYTACVDALSTQASVGPNMIVAPLQEANAEKLQEIADQVTQAVIPNPAIGAIVQESMEPYLRGQETFDVCFEVLFEKLTQYLSE